MTDIPTRSTPTHALYFAQGESDKSQWTRIGVAWAHRDGLGYAIKLEMIPLTGWIQMRVASEVTVHERS
jgi:hypothetical protein